ncbi:MAG: hypothetical protein K6E40_11010 [Desulfovibrio sp.]|nr:hypothetical protein [Desulfovibrio sp.]
MHGIPNPRPSKDFVEAFKAAGRRIQAMATRIGMEVLWIRAEPYGPSLEHLSFFCGGQAYFVQMLDNSGETVFPGGTKEGLLRIAKEYEGFACWMPMRRVSEPGRAPWAPVLPNWGLIDAVSDAFVRPEELTLAEPKAVTRWELHDFAIQFVRESLEKQGRNVLSWNSDPDVEPALWFAGASGRPEWVCVGECLGPASQAPVPESLRELASAMMDRGFRGWWAPVGFAPITRKPGRPDGLYRGEGADVDFKGLRPLPL